MRRRSCRTDNDCSEVQRCGWDSYCEAVPRDTNASVPDEAQDEEELEAAVRNVRQRYRKTASSASSRVTR